MSKNECCFFFQAEDGIRDGHVTGVQTCALPISPEFDPAAFIDTTTVDIGNEFNPEEKNILLSSAPNPGPEIDLLVVYTPTVASASSDINLLIDDAVSQTITTFGNSAVGANVVLQHSAQVNYNESGQTIIQHLTSLIDPSDGIMDNVHSLRNQYMADIVVLLVDDNQYCGVATLLAQQTTAFAVDRKSTRLNS